jgi:hypothetical protein
MTDRVTFVPLVTPGSDSQPSEPSQPLIDAGQLNANNPNAFLNLGLVTVVAVINQDLSLPYGRYLLNGARTLASLRRDALRMQEKSPTIAAGPAVEQRPSE